MDDVRDPRLRHHVNRLLHAETKHETYKLDVLAAVCSARLEAINSDEQVANSSFQPPCTMLINENYDIFFKTEYYSEAKHLAPYEETSWERSTKNTWFRTLLDNYDPTVTKVKEEPMDNMPPLWDLILSFQPQEETEEEGMHEEEVKEEEMEEDDV